MVSSKDSPESQPLSEKSKHPVGSSSIAPTEATFSEMIPSQRVEDSLQTLDCVAVDKSQSMLVELGRNLIAKCI